MMNKDWKTKTDYWFDLAQYDLDTAKAITWAKTQSESEYIHSLARLLKNSGIVTDLPNNLKDLIDVLEPMNIEARYPERSERVSRFHNVQWGNNL